MDYQNKREMILRAFKWREDMKKKSDEELYAQTLMVLMFIITVSNIYYMYNNFDKKIVINNKNQLKYNR
jgi:hypothetical protein